MALKLPMEVVGRADITRMQRELNALDDFFVTASAHKAGTTMAPPRLTRMLNQLAADNQTNLLEAGQRKELNGQLGNLLKNAPLFHISFAAEPSPKALESILAWLRTNIHPQILLEVGLQPAIAAGCVLRTPNKLFDMSLSTYVKKQEPYLVKLIEGAVR